MEPDPVLQEVYQRKEQLNREVDGDVGKLFMRLHLMAEKRRKRTDASAQSNKRKRIS